MENAERVGNTKKEQVLNLLFFVVGVYGFEPQTLCL